MTHEYTGLIIQSSCLSPHQSSKPIIQVDDGMTVVLEVAKSVLQIVSLLSVFLLRQGEILLFFARNAVRPQHQSRSNMIFVLVDGQHSSF